MLWTLLLLSAVQAAEFWHAATSQYFDIKDGVENWIQENGTMPSDTPTYSVNTPLGSIEGRREGKVVKFLGIPYATAPRFAMPLAYVPIEESIHSDKIPWSWSDATYRAHSHGPHCPQSPTNLPQSIRSYFQHHSKDANDTFCLNLSIYTPAPSVPVPNGGFPVLVWIHGGTYAHGSNSQQFNDPSRLVATQNVIVVVPNYRLGAYGFMAFPDSTDANFAFADMRVALRWVNKNISSFQGNPQLVTLGGFSAGGHMANWLAVFDEQDRMTSTTNNLNSSNNSSYAGRLFSRLFFMSGHHQIVPLRTMDEALMDTIALAEKTGFKGDPFDGASLRNHLSAIDPEVITSLVGDLKWSRVFRPILDGVMIRQPMSVYLAKGIWPRVPTLVTTVAEDGSIFVPEIDNANPAEQYAKIIRRTFRDPEVAEQALTLYPLEGDTLQSRLTTIITDLVFRYPAIGLVQQLQMQGHQAWYAEHSAQYNLIKALGPKHLGSFHSIDQLILFGVLRNNLGLVQGSDTILMQKRLANFMILGAPIDDSTGNLWIDLEQLNHLSEKWLKRVLFWSSFGDQLINLESTRMTRLTTDIQVVPSNIRPRRKRAHEDDEGNVDPDLIRHVDKKARVIADVKQPDSVERFNTGAKDKVELAKEKVRDISEVVKENSSKAS